jgi:hypothetical protein
MYRHGIAETLTITRSKSVGRDLARRTPSQMACDDSKAEFNFSPISIFEKIKTMHTRNDAFQLGTHTETSECFLVCSDNILGSAGVFKPCMFRANSWIVEPCTNRMCLYNLASSRLKNICPNTVENAWLAH